MSQYAWFLLKNMLGWILILSSFVLGLVPGPGGIPLFLIGFALVTFPGKRRLTARVLRGRRYRFAGALFTWTVLGTSAALAVVTFWFLTRRYPAAMGGTVWRRVMSTGLCLLAMTAYWLLFAAALHGTNLLLGCVPLARRRVRPWLRRHGVRLLPPRRRHRIRVVFAAGTDAPSTSGPSDETAREEILEIHERHWQRMRRMGRSLWRWLWLVVLVAVAAAALCIVAIAR